MRVRLLIPSLNCDSSQDQLKLVLRDKFIIAYEAGSVQDRLMEKRKSATFQEVVELAAGSKVSLTSAHIKREPEILFMRNSQSGDRKQNPSTTNARIAQQQRESSRSSPGGSTRHRQHRVLLRHRQNIWCVVDEITWRHNVPSEIAIAIFVILKDTLFQCVQVNQVKVEYK